MGIAAAQRGKPYAYGASGPRAFDCSGLTSYAFHRAGFPAMPRTAAAQAHFARHISRGQMRRGDLIFFTGGGGVYHVGLYAGCCTVTGWCCTRRTRASGSSSSRCGPTGGSPAPSASADARRP